MIITILEGKISADKIPLLQEKYKNILHNKPPSIVKTYLTKDIKNQNICRIITVWRSKEDLDEMKMHGTPAGVLIFRECGVEPSLTVHEVTAES